jgi:GWxTD domain-containing protein
VGKVYTQAGLKAVAETARTAVQDLGYFKAIVGDPLVTAETSSEQAPGAPTPVRVRLDITPGGRYYVKEITFDGVSVLPEALLRPLFPPAGDILPITVWRKGFEAMKRLYSARRYYNMTLEPEIWFDDEARTITVRIHVDEGTPGGVIGGLPGGVSARSETGTQAPPPAPLNPTSQAPPPPPPPPPAGVEAPKRILLSTPPPAAKKQASEFPPLPQAPRRIVPPPPSSANKQATEPPPAPPRAPAQAPEPPNKEEAQRLQNLQRELDKPFQRWLNEDVAYIITDEERQAFKRLQNAEEREQFIEQFWLRRDPTPDTAENEYKEEHYRRIAHANEHFASGFPGWRTDRGRIYITFGPPDSIEAYPSDGTSFNIAPPPQVLKVLGFERWRYRYIEGIGSDISIGFADLEGNGDYRASTGPISDTLAARLQPRKP